MEVQHLTPRLVSVRVGGTDLSRFASVAPTSHIKVMIPPPGQREPALPRETAEGRTWPEGVDRPEVRTYTPRAYDPETGLLEIQFVVHEDGPASSWAAAAKPGDRIGLRGPGGRFAFPESPRRWWLAGDESALPAIAQLLEALPDDTDVEAHIEVESDADEIPLEAPSGATVVWHHRTPHTAWSGTLLAALDERLAAGEGTSADALGRMFWVACEAGAVRDARARMLAAGVCRDEMITRGYWRLGERNHPDHDYGED